MTTINIQTTADKGSLEAIKTLLFKIDPNAIFESNNQHYEISQEDQEKLREIIEADKRGEIKYQNIDEFDIEMREFLKSLGA